VGASLLRSTRTLADVNTKSCDDEYPAERSGSVLNSACAVDTKRQQEVNEKYHKKAGELDLEQAQHQAARVHSGKNSTSTDKRAE
jgi:hypothetical protein